MNEDDVKELNELVSQLRKLAENLVLQFGK